MSRKIHRYGWIPSLPDHRDHLYTPTLHVADLPTSVDLHPHCPPVYDQGALGSCSANALAGALEFDQMKEALPVYTPSRLFIYYNERSIEGTVNSDSGAQLRDGIKSVARIGACSEQEWPYDISQFTTKPSAQCYQEASQHRAIAYARVLQDLGQMKGCLASGYPFILGFTVYESFESNAVASTGIVNMPLPGESVVGGHAVVAVGYDDSTQRWLVRNSWGSSWGQAGYFTMPYAYLLSGNLAADFWTIRTVK